MNAGDLVTGVHCACRGDSRVDAARHRGQNPHVAPFPVTRPARQCRDTLPREREAEVLADGPSRAVASAQRRLPAHQGARLPQATAPARRARETASGSAAARASMSPAVDVCPSENLSDDRASASLLPMASRTWLGCATPAEQAEPVEQSMPAASSRRSKASAEQPGKLTLTMPGSTSAGFAGPWTTASGTAA